MFALWRPTRSVEEAKSKLNYWKSNVYGNGFFCLIQDVNSENIIGFVTCDEIENNIYGNIGIFIGEQFTNKGFGSQTLSMLIKQIKKNDGKEIHYSHFKENEASKKIGIKTWI